MQMSPSSAFGLSLIDYSSSRSRNGLQCGFMAGLVLQGCTFQIVYFYVEHYG